MSSRCLNQAKEAGVTFPQVATLSSKSDLGPVPLVALDMPEHTPKMAMGLAQTNWGYYRDHLMTNMYFFFWNLLISGMVCACLENIHMMKLQKHLYNR